MLAKLKHYLNLITIDTHTHTLAYRATYLTIQICNEWGERNPIETEKEKEYENGKEKEKEKKIKVGGFSAAMSPFNCSYVSITEDCVIVW